MNATVLLTSVDIAIPGYRILRPIGEGGMASVFLAVQESLDREIALKVMSPALSSNAEFARRFLVEGKITAKLQHPNLVTVYDIGSHNGVYYLAAEYIPGGTLKDRISAGGLSVAEILDIASDIAQGLDFAHEKGFVHRDVKPGNVLFRNDGRVVLADFGIAKAMDGSNSSTVAGMSVGTPDYMSPEQARGEPVDGRSDLYSLGTVLYEMLVGHGPYQATDPFTVALMHVTHPVPTLPAPFEWLQPLVEGLMAKSAAERYNSGAAFIAALHALVATAPQGATVQASATRKAGNDRLSGSSATQQRTRISASEAASKRPVWVLPVAAGGLVLATAIAAWAVLSPSSPEVADAALPVATVSAPARSIPTDSVVIGAPSNTANPEVRVPVSVDDQDKQILSWLQQAKAYKDYAFARPEDGGRGLFQPIGENAIDYYLKVVAVQPNNPEAKQGLHEVADWIYDRTYRLCFEKHQWAACRIISEQGLRAQPNHFGLQELVEDAKRGEAGAVAPEHPKR